MIKVSSEFRQLMQERTDFKCNAEVTFSDGNMLSLAEDDFMLSGNCIVDGAGADGLPLGVAVGRTIQIAIMNDDGHLAEYDFFGAQIRLYLVFELSETMESIEEGTFTVLDPETYGDTVSVTASDAMYKADKDYTTTLAFPASLEEMYKDACGSCGIPYLASDFPNSDYIVESMPSGEYTFREIFGYIAMLAGGNARINRLGYMEILTYDLWTENNDHTLSDWSSLTVATDDIFVTGLQTTVSSTDEEEDETETSVLQGEEGYVLELENPLFAGKETVALGLIAPYVVGSAFRKFEGDHIGYPLAEFMDTVTIIDRKGNSYRSVITDIDFVFCGFTSLSNSATAAVRNSSKYISAETKTIVAAKKLVEQEKSSRVDAVEQLNRLLSERSGMYSTEATQTDGSVICYLHDKPELSDSTNIMKLTAASIALSTDGGKTYPFGFGGT